MNSGVTAGGPTTPQPEQLPVIGLSNEDTAVLLDLGVALQAEVQVALDHELRVERTVRLMAGGASFAHGFMLEHKWASLIAVTIGAAFVQSGHGQSAGRLPNIVAVGIMTVAATHAAFEHRMVLRQIELRMRRQMTLEAGCGIAARIDDQITCTGRRHMAATWTVTRFAAGLPGHLESIVAMEPAVGAAGKDSSVVFMALGAGRVAHKRRAFDGWRGVYRAVESSAGGQKQQYREPNAGQKAAGP